MTCNSDSQALACVRIAWKSYPCCCAPMRVSNSLRQGLGPRTCLFKKPPGDVNGTGLGKALVEPLNYSVSTHQWAWVWVPEYKGQVGGDGVYLQGRGGCWCSLLAASGASPGFWGLLCPPPGSGSGLASLAPRCETAHHSQSPRWAGEKGERQKVCGMPSTACTMCELDWDSLRFILE